MLGQLVCFCRRSLRISARYLCVLVPCPSLRSRLGDATQYAGQRQHTCLRQIKIITTTFRLLKLENANDLTETKLHGKPRRLAASRLILGSASPVRTPVSARCFSCLLCHPLGVLGSAGCVMAGATARGPWAVREVWWLGGRARVGERKDWGGSTGRLALPIATEDSCERTVPFWCLLWCVDWVPSD